KYRDRFYFYQPGMASEINSRVQLQKDLQKALECNELELYYQPKIALKTALCKVPKAYCVGSIQRREL
ncbi:MAG: hypothetical protein ACPGHU_04575, partial [Porticoccaceae bacterium]